MKKILAIILALTCAFAMFACSDKGDENNYKTDAADFISAISATKVNTLTATVKVDTLLGELNSSYTTVYNADGSGTMTYSIEQFLTSEEAEDKGVIEGTVTITADGQYSDGGSVSGKLGARGVTFDADSDKITQYKVEGNVLTITVPSADSKAILGYEIEGDAVVVVTKADGQITSISLSYTGATIVCSYN